MRHGLQDRACTPGALNPAVSRRTLGRTICRSGYTSRIRPPSGYTEPLKYRIMAAYGFAGASASRFGLDHLIPLELGGAPSDPRNLWLEPEAGRGAFAKDGLENSLNAEVCGGAISLAAAQRRILDWVRLYSGSGGRSPEGPVGTPPGGDRDCSDFATHTRAQRFFRLHHCSPSRDVDRLDSDHDGVACGTLP